MLFSFLKVELLKHFMKLVDVGDRLADDCFSVIFAELVGKVFFFGRMEESANFRLVTSQLVTAYSLVLIGVVKTLDRGMTFGAFEPLRTLLPSDSFLKDLTIFR